MRVGPILYREIEAWSRMTGARATPLEVEAIVSIDKAFLAWQRAQDAKPSDAPAAPKPEAKLTASTFDLLFG